MENYYKLLYQYTDKVDDPLIDNVEKAFSILEDTVSSLLNTRVVCMCPTIFVNEINKLDWTRSHREDMGVWEGVKSHILNKIQSMATKKTLVIGEKITQFPENTTLSMETLINEPNILSNDLVIITDMTKIGLPPNGIFDAVLDKAQKILIVIPPKNPYRILSLINNLADIAIINYSMNYCVDRVLYFIDKHICSADGILLEFKNKNVFGSDRWIKYLARSIYDRGKVYRMDPMIFYRGDSFRESHPEMDKMLDQIGLKFIPELVGDIKLPRDEWHGKPLILQHQFRVFVDTEKCFMLFTTNDEIPRNIKSIVFQPVFVKSE